MKNLFSIFLFSLFLFALINILSNDYLTDQVIHEIYNNYVKPNLNEEYKKRYVPLPLHKNNTPWKWEGKDFPRVIAILEFERYIKENNISCEKGLAINGRDPEWYYLSAKNIAEANYLENPQNFNLYTLDLYENDFDFVMVNQTLEHIYDPIRVLKNIYKHMKPGGILYLNVPANNIPHDTPIHFYTGYTPVGIGAVVKSAGFKILSIGQWGNLEYLKKMFESQDWPDYRQLKNPGLNDFNCPVITWIFATK